MQARIPDTTYSLDASGSALAADEREDGHTSAERQARCSNLLGFDPQGGECRIVTAEPRLRGGYHVER